MVRNDNFASEFLLKEFRNHAVINPGKIELPLFENVAVAKVLATIASNYFQKAWNYVGPW